MNQKQRKEIRDKIASGLMYMISDDIPHQWKCCEAHADIIIDIIEDLMVKEYQRGWNTCVEKIVNQKK